MPNHSDALSLIEVHTSINVVVAAKDEDDAERIVRENYGDIVDSMFRNDKNVVEIHGYSYIEELPQDSPLRNYHPHGDEWGTQETAEYYTTVEYNKRQEEEYERGNKIQALIESLDEEETRLLQEHFLGQLRWSGSVTKPVSSREASAAAKL
jgi:hypothetical protein